MAQLLPLLEVSFREIVLVQRYPYKYVVLLLYRTERTIT